MVPLMTRPRGAWDWRSDGTAAASAAAGNGRRPAPAPWTRAQTISTRQGVRRRRRFQRIPPTPAGRVDDARPPLPVGRVPPPARRPPAGGVPKRVTPPRGRPRRAGGGARDRPRRCAPCTRAPPRRGCRRVRRRRDAMRSLPPPVAPAGHPPPARRWPRAARRGGGAAWGCLWRPRGAAGVPAVAVADGRREVATAGRGGAPRCAHRAVVVAGNDRRHAEGRRASPVPHLGRPARSDGPGIQAGAPPTRGARVATPLRSTAAPPPLPPPPFPPPAANIPAPTLPPAALDGLFHLLLVALTGSSGERMRAACGGNGGGDNGDGDGDGNDNDNGDGVAPSRHVRLVTHRAWAAVAPAGTVCHAWRAAFRHCFLGVDVSFAEWETVVGAPAGGDMRVTPPPPPPAGRSLGHTVVQRVGGAVGVLLKLPPPHRPVGDLRDAPRDGGAAAGGGGGAAVARSEPPPAAADAADALALATDAAVTRLLADVGGLPALWRLDVALASPATAAAGSGGGGGGSGGGGSGGGGGGGGGGATVPDGRVGFSIPRLRETELDGNNDGVTAVCGCVRRAA
ncbi:hypothetical protein BU14_0027s0021 [Porphyra umbilicalis]|uniref:Uncharacterized protein n=1 Tax=Porphyra umbilicalis TaxID=2786 RepID=A0A1X6PJM0_PORUM|nr:hypothetical protein BU14_0027s0021 [Porphyra umbilicalis]|eukprot:OSX80995.1 hypothetical protein BU14_0027s0021 [Porphyra umbilicalis]